VSNIVQIRELLAGKFPGLRIASEPPPLRDVPVWPTGLFALDHALPGGLPRGSLTELCAPENAFGSGLILRQIIRQAAASHQWIALIDGADCFDPNSFDNATLEHVLWVRCKKADEAVKCADLILRDGNLPIIVLDLALSAVRELRKIPSSTWYRFQRLVEDGAAAFVTITPTPIASSAKHRIFLRGKMPADAFDLNELELLKHLVIENAEVQHELDLQASHA
jgi:hypothetical protein